LAFWKLVLEYEGTDFSGWQRQKGLRTVQGELDRALATVLRRAVRVEGAGRTDAGVHALGQVASFEIDADVRSQVFSINAVLPDDVVVRSVESFTESFHARRDAVRRHYRYRLHRGATALERRTSLSVQRELDLDAMREGGGMLLGAHDFTSFATEPGPCEDPRVSLERLEIREEGEFLNIEVTADRFLRKMVRTIVGTLLDVGRGKEPPSSVGEALAARDRRAAGPVAPPRGLFLVAVDY
jgi:tRNA pseudouridine38-40 synthase